MSVDAKRVSIPVLVNSLPLALTVRLLFQIIRLLPTSKATASVLTLHQRCWGSIRLLSWHMVEGVRSFGWSFMQVKKHSVSMVISLAA